MQINSAKDLRVYTKANDLAGDIFATSMDWPEDENAALIQQIRQSSRFVCIHLREAWSKRRFQAEFTGKLTDADAENAVTDSWLDIAKSCNYISEEKHKELTEECAIIGKMLGKMIHNSSSFFQKAKKSETA